MTIDTNPVGETAKPRRLATIKEACEYGRMGKDTLYSYMNNGIIRAYKRQATTLVDLNSIDELNESLPPYVPPLLRDKPVAGTEPGGNMAAADRQRRQASLIVGISRRAFEG